MSLLAMLHVNLRANGPHNKLQLMPKFPFPINSSIAALASQSFPIDGAAFVLLNADCSGRVVAEPWVLPPAG